MARNFATGYYLESTTAPDLTSSHSVSCLFNPNTVSGIQTLLVSNNSGTANTQYNLFINGGKISTYGTAFVDGTTTLSTGTWYQGGCAFVAGDLRDYVYLNGTSENNAAGNKSGTTNRIRIGRHDSIYDGLSKIAEVGVWSIALAATDWTMLGLGFSPLLVRPDALVFYTPLWGEGTTAEVDVRGGHNLTTFNGPPTATAHPRVFYATRSSARVPGPAATGGGPKVFMNHYRRRRAS